MADLELLLSRLDKVRRTGAHTHIACCPHHGDKNPSMQITETDNRVLIHCFSQGCGSAEILDSIGLDHRVLYPEDDGSYNPRQRVKVDPIDAIYVEVYMAQRRSGKVPTKAEKDRYINLIGVNNGY